MAEGPDSPGALEVGFAGSLHPLSLIDSHCHLDQPQFDADRAEVIARALEAGVETIINPGIDLASSRQAVDLAEGYPSIYAAVGVHPNDCAGFDEDALRELRDLAGHPKVVAIGEIGLDYYWKQVAPEQQKRALRAQLELAAELRLPVILHSRDSDADLLWELSQWGPVIRKRFGRDAMVGVWHAFSGDLPEAQAAYEEGLVLGLGGPVTFRNARRLHALVPRLRFDRLMLETDAPYLAPHPHRGQRNEPGYLPLMLEALADLYSVSRSSVAAQTTDTATQLFRLKS